MIVDAGRVGESHGARSVDRVDLAILVRHLDWVLLTAVAGLVAYGLWAIGGITRFDVPGDPDLFVRRQGVAAMLGLVGLTLAFCVPPGLFQRLWRGMLVARMRATSSMMRSIRGSRAKAQLRAMTYACARL